MGVMYIAVHRLASLARKIGVCLVISENWVGTHGYFADGESKRIGVDRRMYVFRVWNHVL